MTPPFYVVGRTQLLHIHAANDPRHLHRVNGVLCNNPGAYVRARDRQLTDFPVCSTCTRVLGEAEQ